MNYNSEQKQKQIENSLLKQEEEKKAFEEYAKTNSNIFMSSVKYSKSLYDNYDLAFYSGKTKESRRIIGAEIKVRTYPLEFFRECPPYLELHKFMHMLNLKAKLWNERKIFVHLYYYNFTSDGYLQLFPLKDTINFYDWESCFLPIDDYAPWKKCWKMVTELKYIEDTIKIA